MTSFKHPHDNKSIGKGEEGQSSILYCLVCGANLTCVKSEKQTLRWAGQNLANRDSSVQWDRPGFTLISCTIYITKLDSECKQFLRKRNRNRINRKTYFHSQATFLPFYPRPNHCPCSKISLHSRICLLCFRARLKSSCFWSPFASSALLPLVLG